MPANLIVIGLDACEATILEEGARSGAYKTFRSIIEQAPATPLSTPLDTLPGAIWPEIVTGRSGGRSGHYFHPAQIHTGEARLRAVGAEEQDIGTYYWSVASRAGRRVAVIDQPQAALCQDINGLHVLEWGCHDRTYSAMASPDGLMDELLGRYKSHPVHLCDRFSTRRNGLQSLLTGLSNGLQTKEALLLDLLGREQWDLFTCGISESHCVGHHFWSLHDSNDPRHDANASADMKAAIRNLYGLIDSVVGRLIQAAGPGAQVIVFTSHGMGPYIGGYQLIAEVLTRLGLSSDQGKAQSSWFRRLQYAAREYTPHSLRPVVKATQKLAPVGKLQAYSGALLQPLADRRSRAASVPNNRVGAIRLNVAGREPYGCVQPGAEAEQLIADLRRELLSLVNPDTGQPIVKSTVTPQEAFGDGYHRDVPDLMVAFHRDRGAIEACYSDAVGTIRIPFYTRAMVRTGDHTDVSKLWMIGCETTLGETSCEASVQDIAPTVLSLLDIPAPSFIDGRSLVAPHVPA